MKRSKLIIRFLEKNDGQSVSKLLKGLFEEWKATTVPPIKIEQYVRMQLTENADFILELDQYVWHGNFSELGFYILVKSFFDNCCFKEREQFMNEFLEDWKNNSSARKKRMTIRKLDSIQVFLKELHKLNLNPIL